MKQLVTFFLLISALRVTAQVTIDHVEPPHWWIGMEHANVEILLHGKGIANYEISSPQLKIIGRGTISRFEVLFCPNASANLIPMYVFTCMKARVIFDSEGDHNNVNNHYCEIKVNDGSTIEATRRNNLWWITMDQLFDLILRNGFSVEQLQQ